LLIYLILKSPSGLNKLISDLITQVS